MGETFLSAPLVTQNYTFSRKPQLQSFGSVFRYFIRHAEAGLCVGRDQGVPCCAGQGSGGRSRPSVRLETRSGVKGSRALLRHAGQGIRVDAVAIEVLASERIPLCRDRRRRPGRYGCTTGKGEH
jgi:hypothetical protein